MWSADRRERAAAALKARIEQAQAIRRAEGHARRYRRRLARDRQRTAERRLERQYASVLRPSSARPRKPDPAYAVWATERCQTCAGAGTLLSGNPCPCVVGRIARRSAERYRASPPCAWRIEFAWCVGRASVPADWHMIRLHGQTRPQAWWLRQGGRNRMRRWDIAVGREILAAGITLPHV